MDSNNCVIAYVSHLSPTCDQNDVHEILEQTNEYNNRNNITGVLLYSEGNFFQVLEGEETLIENLFDNIKSDQRHENLIVIFRNRLVRHAFNGYIADFLTAEKKLEEKTINEYLQHIRLIDAKSQAVVTNIIQAFLR